MNKEEIYNNFIKYYGDLELRRTKEIGKNWLVYSCKVKNFLTQNRYIHVVIKYDFNIPVKINLSNLEWLSFQTRTNDEYIENIEEYTLELNTNKKELFKEKIVLKDRNKEKTVYFSTLKPLKIELIHEAKKKNIFQYPDELKLYQALETYKCVINLS